VTPSLTSRSALCREEFGYHGWVTGSEEGCVVGEVSEAAHPPFGADLSFAGKRFEHLVDGELKAEVSSATEVAQIEKVIDDRPLANGRTVDLFNEYFCLHREIVVQFRGCIVRHELLFGRRGQRMRSSTVFFDTNVSFLYAWVEFLINRVTLRAVSTDVNFRQAHRNRRSTSFVARLSGVAVVAVLAATLATVSSAGAVEPVMCGGQVATIVGTTGDDVLTGTNGVDVIAALGGDDVVYGLAGADLICGSHGNDRLYGGDGADKIYAFNGADRLEGGSGPDILYGGYGKDTLLGDNGQDTLKGGPGFDTLMGGAQRDILRGGKHLDSLFGGTELDTCYSPGDILSECEKGGGQNVAGPSLTAQYSNEMFRLINLERGKTSNLGALTRHPDLDAYARDWALVMSQQPLPLTSAKHHSPAFTGSTIPFRGLPTSVQWTRAFENVGYSSVGNGESVESVMERLFYSPNGFGFMSSDGHRCNILETAATQVGVGSYIDSSGDVWVVQVFWGTYSPVPSATPTCTSVVGR